MADTTLPEGVKRYLICPNGRITTRIIMHTVEGADIAEVDVQGNVSDWHTSDFPNLEPAGDDRQHVNDGDGNDFLWRHCRLTTGPADYDHWNEEGAGIEPWPDEIIDACAHAEHVAWCLWWLDQFDQSLPPRYRDDAAFQAAMSHIVKGRLEGELTVLEDRIAAFRKDRVEATSFDHAHEGCRTEGCENDPDDGEGYEGDPHKL